MPKQLSDQEFAALWAAVTDQLDAASAHARLTRTVQGRSHELLGLAEPMDGEPTGAAPFRPGRGVQKGPIGPRVCRVCFARKGHDEFPKGRQTCKLCTNANHREWRRTRTKKGCGLTNEDLARLAQAAREQFLRAQGLSPPDWHALAPAAQDAWTKVVAFVVLEAAKNAQRSRKLERLTREELGVIWQSNGWQNHSDKNLSDLIQDALIRKNGGD